MDFIKNTKWIQTPLKLEDYGQQGLFYGETFSLYQECPTIIHKLISEGKTKEVVDSIYKVIIEIKIRKDKNFKMKNIFRKIHQFKNNQWEENELYQSLKEAVSSCKDKIDSKTKSRFFIKMNLLNTQNEQQFHQVCDLIKPEKIGGEQFWELFSEVKNHQGIQLKLNCAKVFPNLSYSHHSKLDWIDHDKIMRHITLKDISRTLFDGLKLIPRSIFIGKENLLEKLDFIADSQEGFEQNFYERIVGALNNLLYHHKKIKQKASHNLIQEAVLEYKKNGIPGLLDETLDLLKGFSFNAFGPACVLLTERYPAWNGPHINDGSFKSVQNHESGTHYDVQYNKVTEVVEMTQKREWVIKDYEGKCYATYLSDWTLYLGFPWRGQLHIHTVKYFPELIPEEIFKMDSLLNFLQK